MHSETYDPDIELSILINIALLMIQGTDCMHTVFLQPKFKGKCILQCSIPSCQVQWTMWYAWVWFGLGTNGIVRFGLVWSSWVCYSMVWYDMVQYGMLWYRMVFPPGRSSGQCGAVWAAPSHWLQHSPPPVCASCTWESKPRMYWAVFAGPRFSTKAYITYTAERRYILGFTSMTTQRFTEDVVIHQEARGNHQKYRCSLDIPISWPGQEGVLC